MHILRKAFRMFSICFVHKCSCALEVKVCTYIRWILLYNKMYDSSSQCQRLNLFDSILDYALQHVGYANYNLFS